MYRKGFHMRSLSFSRSFGILISALCLGALLTACGASSSSSGSSSSNILNSAPAEAANVYKQSCLQCHGGNLEGRMGKDTNLQTIGDNMTKEEIIDKIHNGGKRMPQVGRSMEEGDIDKVAEWLSTLKSNAAESANEPAA